jgi:hypothetical protein
MKQTRLKSFVIIAIVITFLTFLLKQLGREYNIRNEFLLVIAMVISGVLILSFFFKENITKHTK